MNKLKGLILLMCITFASLGNSVCAIEFTKAGFLEVPNGGRSVFNFNVGWRFIKTDVVGAHEKNFDDSSWEVINCPHGLELISTEASGSNNYQGPAWYRKHFTPDAALTGKQLKLHFEGVMGKSKVYINGKLVKEQFGGYLPFSVDLTGKLKMGEENVIAVWADNSDDPDYPPGKPQASLDFSYFGGIYRDVWLVATQSVFVTNANDEDIVNGGGLTVRFDKLSDDFAEVIVKAHVRNAANQNKSVRVKYRLIDPKGTEVASYSARTTVKKEGAKTLTAQLPVSKPQLWSPQSPALYRLEVAIVDRKGKAVDAVAQNIGIRKIEMRGKDGFWLNNKPYEGKLIGVNRHQDHACVGNALSNNGQWRDAVLLKNAGCDIVRAAHYPVDDAFMEACDALGMFYIVATPGWQFWNKKPIFEQRVYSDIKNMVRRDRNHPCVLMWEPILNETWYPDYFAKKVHELVHAELPHQGTYTVCDSHARGQEHFDVIYSHPFRSDFYKGKFANTKENTEKLSIAYEKENRCVFTREWGDCVDDWNSHNSPSRVARNWGEHAQLVQLKHYASPDYVYTCWETLYRTPKQHIGGALWHSFDHQRGYHPDPFYGGITDVFRQPKYSFYLFESQMDPAVKPMIYVAHEMSPFSEKDVTILTNCDEVRLIVYEKDTLTAKPDKKNMMMPHPVVVFKDVFDFMDVKSLHRKRKMKQASFVAEGLIDGKVVARYKRMPSKRASKVQLKLSDNNVALTANGSDAVVVVASMVDQDGIVKRLTNHTVKFEIEGEGELVGDMTNDANPKRMEWGEAAIMVRSTTKAGKIKIKATVLDEGINMPVGSELVIETQPTTDKMVYSEVGKAQVVNTVGPVEENNKVTNWEKKAKALERELNKYRMKEVEKQQQEFEAK
ncbi:glycoside hydrolase family 2 protein [Prolixibacteraceae bacterium JC049]|nr:glycoside hydrolase family 2 protein [Prolixibacteraceae bacterium JC049]